MKTRNFTSTLLCATLFCSLVAATSCNQAPSYTGEEDTLPKVEIEEGSTCYEVDHSEVIHLRLDVISDKIIGGFFLVKNTQWDTLSYAFSGKIIEDSRYRVVLQTPEEAREEEWILHFKDGQLELSGISLFNKGTVLTAVDCADFPNHYSIRSAEDIRNFLDPNAYYENENATCFYIYESTRGGRIHTQEYIWLESSGDQVKGCGTGTSEGQPDWGFEFEGHFTEPGVAAVTVHYLQEGYVEIECCSTFTRNESWQIDLTKGTIRLDHATVTDNLISLEGELYAIPCDAVDDWALKNRQRQLRRSKAKE